MMIGSRRPPSGPAWLPRALMFALLGLALGQSTARPRLARAADAPPGVARYRGIHPRWPQTGGFCYIDVPHVHHKGPTDLRAYRVLPGGENLFVGDPVALGYEGETFGYFGPHPVEVPGSSTGSEPVFCYLRGPHFHSEPPGPAAPFVEKAGVYWFTGRFSPSFERDLYYAWINDTPVLTSYRPPKVSRQDAPVGYVFPDALQVRAAVPPATPASLPAATSGRSHREGSLPPPPARPIKAAAKRGPS